MRISLCLSLLLIALAVFSQDRSNVNDTKVQDSVIMSRVIRMPEFPGGESALMDLILKKVNRITPDSAMNEHPASKIVVRYIVNEDGTISDFKILKSISPSFDSQVIEILKSLPRFQPALDIHNLPVKAVLKLPVYIHLSMDK